MNKIVHNIGYTHESEHDAKFSEIHRSSHTTLFDFIFPIFFQHFLLVFNSFRSLLHVVWLYVCVKASVSHSFHSICWTYEDHNYNNNNSYCCGKIAFIHIRTVWKFADVRERQKNRLLNGTNNYSSLNTRKICERGWDSETEIQNKE